MINNIKKLMYLVSIVGVFFIGVSSAMAAATVSYGGVTYGIGNDGAVTDPSGVAIGTFNGATGDFTAPGGGSINLADLTGAVVSATTAGGGSVTTVMDGHNYAYQQEMFISGYNYVSAIESGDTAAATAVVESINATLSEWTGGTQPSITVVGNLDGSVSFGCVNSQNTTITFPPAQPVATATPVISVTPVTPLPATYTPDPSYTAPGGSAVPIDPVTPVVPASPDIRIREVLPGE